MKSFKKKSNINERFFPKQKGPAQVRNGIHRDFG